MSLRGLEYGVVESATAIRRNLLISIASIFTVALTLTVLAGFALFSLWLNNAAQSVLGKFEIAVFLDKGVPNADIVELREKIKNLPHVANVSLETADEAWAKMKQNLGDAIASGVATNPLPDSLRVKADDPKYTAQIAAAITKMQNVDTVRDGMDYVDPVVSIARVIKLASGIAAGILFLVTAFLIGNTIRLTVYARRREIRIMQLVGATNWFIRMPFFFEGITLGALGGGFAYLTMYGSSYYLTRFIERNVPLLGQFSTDVDPLMLAGGIVVLGCLMGGISSLVSMRRFLKTCVH